MSDSKSVKRVSARERELIALARRSGTFGLLFELAQAAPVAPAKANPFKRIPCAYGTCDKTFLPNGSGSKQHTTCPMGMAALNATRLAAKTN